LLAVVAAAVDYLQLITQVVVVEEDLELVLVCLLLLDLLM
jgi:hypothetical protein